MLFEWLLSPCLVFVHKYCKSFVRCDALHLVQNMLKLYTCLLEEVK